MHKLIKYIFVLTTMFSCGFVLNAETVIDKKSLRSSLKRVPAEWEPQAGVWLQWPGPWERSYERDFARIASVIVRYQPLHILYSSKSIRANAEEAIKRVRPTVTPEMLDYYQKMETRLTSGLSNIKRNRDTSFGMESM